MIRMKVLRHCFLQRRIPLISRRSLVTLGMTMAASFLLPLLTFAANQSDLEKLLALQPKTTQAIHLDLSNTDLRHYIFIPGKIDLRGANLSHSNLSGVDLSKMDLGGADLSYADLSNAKLNQVNLTNANLTYANLSGADLQSSSFSHANLSCANLNQANLSQSSFAEAIISGATFTNTITADIVGYDSVIDKKISC